MPKLDDYDDTHGPVSLNAQASLSAKLGAGGNTTPSTTTNPFSPSQSTFASSPANMAPVSTPTFGSGTSSFGGSGTTGGFSSNPFGNSNAGSGFGSSSGGFGSTTPSGLNTSGQSTQAQSLQTTGGAMQEGGTTTIETSQGFGDFINSKWRPLMAVIYMITCCTDFVIFPVLWSILQAMYHGTVTSQWQPLTLQGAGLYHIAMGAVLGLAAYGRSQEKIAGKA